jgi:hypothetical protein
LSPILKVIDGLQTSPWNFWKLCLGPLSPSSSLLALFSPPPLCSAPPARRGEPTGHLCFALAPTRRAAPPPPPVASRWNLPCYAMRPAEPRTARASATSPPRWSAHEHHKSPSKPFLSPFRLLLAPTPQNAAAAPPRTPGSFDAAAEPPHRSSSARSDPLASTVVTPRSSPTTSPRPTHTGAP